MKPDPSKVGAAPPAALDAAALAPDSADDAADPAADVAAAADVVLAVLLSLPQALSVNAPTAIRATRPLIRVIFTLSSIDCHDYSTSTAPVRGTVEPPVVDNVGP